MNKKDMTFIRTQADTFCWATGAARYLKNLGVLGDEDVEAVKRAAKKILDYAREDPQFVGDKIAQYEVETRT